MSEELIQPSRARRLIAKRMVESIQTTPHFFLRRRLRVDRLLERHQGLRDGGLRVTLNDLFVLAAGRALHEVAAMNVTWTDSGMKQFTSANVAIAIGSARGLVAPTIVAVEDHDERTLALERTQLVERANAGELGTGDFAPAALTVSNLGMFGIDEFAGIITPGQSAILAIGTVTEMPVVLSGRVRPAAVVSCTLSVDHRVLDGGIAAAWFAAFAAQIQGDG